VSLRRLLASLSWAYGAAAALRRAAYQELLPVVRAPVPVISVGSLRLGGSGKTPVTGWLARELLRRGLRVGVVHGGYRGSESGRVQRVWPEARLELDAARRLGDEPLLLAAWLPEAIVCCGRDKAEAARLAAAAGAEVILVDDGFQHRRLHRDLDLLLHDGLATRPLPAGDGRELASAARAADLCWLHRREPGPVGDGPLASRLVPDRLLTLDGARLGAAGDLRGRSVFVLAGIARPAAFLSHVRALGAEVRGHLWLRDHGRLGARQLRRAARSGAEVLLCTEKDAARVGPRGGAALSRELVALAAEVELVRGAESLDRALRLVLTAGAS